MHTINIHNYDEIDDLVDFLSHITKHDYNVALHLLDTLGAVTALERLKYDAYEKVELPKSFAGYEILTHEVKWIKVLHDFKIGTKGERILVLEDNPDEAITYSKALYGTPKIYDYREVPKTLEAIGKATPSNSGKRSKSKAEWEFPVDAK